MESKEIYPCVKCTRSTFNNKIAPKLSKWGYKIESIDYVWSAMTYVCTNFTGDNRCVSNLCLDDVDDRDRYLCGSIPEFLEAAKALAIERGWFKEEAMEWEPKCDISELPPRLRRLAEYRKENTTHVPDECSNTVNAFWWNCTDEGFEFWRDVYYGFIPSNLEDVLDEFEKTHPELCGGEEAESNATDGAGKAFEALISAATKAVVEAEKALIKEILSQK